MDVRQAFDEAYRAFMQALQAAARDNVEQRATEAYANYTRVLQEALTGDLQRRAGEAYANYVRVLQEAWGTGEPQRRAADAYRTYVQAIKDAWARVEVDALDATSMIGISQNMMMAAWTVTTGATGAALVATGSPPPAAVPLGITLRY
jgi:hypothetical protein